MKSILISHAKIESRLYVAVAIVSFTFILFFVLPLASAGTAEIKVAAEGGGDFIFKDLQVSSEEQGYPRLTGTVQNNTNKDWTVVTFEIYAYDTTGEQIKTGIIEKPRMIHMLDFKRNAIERFTESVDNKVTSAVRFEVRFKSGQHFTTYIFSMFKPKESKALSFEDRNIKVSFAISKKEIQFVLENKTEGPIKLDWNQVSYVDVFGESHRVMHSGAKYIDKDKYQPPTIIPPTAKVSDMVFPTDHVHYSSGKGGGWEETNMFPEAPLVKRYKGKKFSVFMPMEVNAKIINYFFSFKIDDVIY